MSKRAIFTNTWNSYLEYFEEKRKDVYFTEEYVKLYESNRDIAECFVYKDSNRVFLLPYLKRKIEILNGEHFDFETAYGYGGPIANTDDPSFIENALNEFLLLAKKNKIVAGFIRFHPLLNNHFYLVDKINIAFDRKTMIMNLGLGEDEIWKSIHPKHRNSIRKAQKFGLQFVVDEKLKHLNAFKEIYKLTMNRLRTDAFYFFKDEYFNRLKNLNENIFLGLVYFGVKIISSALFLRYGRYGHYHLAGSLEDYTCYGPNNFLLYETALFLKKQGIKGFHLGGGINNSENNSLYKFKRRFSDNELSFYIGKLILDVAVHKEACDIWEKRFPDKGQIYRNLCLKYRY